MGETFFSHGLANPSCSQVPLFGSVMWLSPFSVRLPMYDG
jgi:hypothetical protein